MKKITPLVLSSILLLGTVACGNNAKTSSNAPDSTEGTGKVVTDKTVETDRKDATSQVRRDQLNADIRAREQRNDAMGNPTKRPDSDLASEVRSKLEANIPKGNLTVESKDANVVVSGTVPSLNDLDKVQGLAMEIKGVKTVTIKAVVASN